VKLINVRNGLGAAISMSVALTVPVPWEFMNLGDCYAESGDSAGLMQKYARPAATIVTAVNKVRTR
jgi:transketolase